MVKIVPLLHSILSWYLYLTVMERSQANSFLVRLKALLEYSQRKYAIETIAIFVLRTPKPYLVRDSWVLRTTFSLHLGQEKMVDERQGP
jgi:hypothetical protein